LAPQREATAALAAREAAAVLAPQGEAAAAVAAALAPQREAAVPAPQGQAAAAAAPTGAQQGGEPGALVAARRHTATSPPEAAY